ncbi:hypothetical protein F511_40700 [Dorcoceras hygrometricum]|uniref:Uncharacterized protein n=1 Tax=Dorcoceras hygrometricum TaxID=472368 RepID=A0A2Z7CC07_9LAMI|nr:hypothetical protein F511_40700 [Dorcoceras hygrometricum]
MQMDSDLMIYRTTLVRTFQVITIYRVDKSEVLVVLISPHYSKRHLRLYMIDRSDMIGDQDYDDATVVVMNRMATLSTLDTTLDIRVAAPSPHSLSHDRRPPRAAVRHAAAHRRCSRDWTCSNHVDEEIPFVSNSSALLVQTDEGVLFPIMDRIRRSTAANLEVPVSL